jgi:two-component system sensor histidine kinase/response regulator
MAVALRVSEPPPRRPALQERPPAPSGPRVPEDKEPQAALLRPGAGPESFLPQLLRASALLIVFFEILYAAEHWYFDPAGFRATFAWHLLNIAIGAGFLRLSYSRVLTRFWRAATLFVCAALMASTTAIGLGGGSVEPLFVTVIAIVIGAGSLVPWDRPWQAVTSGAGVLCFYGLVQTHPGADPNALIHWMGLGMAAGIAQFSVLIQQRYRREIADKMRALTDKHRELREQIMARERLAAEREAAQSRLAEREAALRKIFDSALDMIMVTRVVDGSFLRVNEQFLKLTGYTRAEVLNVRSTELGIWTNPQQREEFRRRLNTGAFVSNMAIDFTTKNGDVVPLLASAVPVEIDGERCVLTISRDVRDVRESERKIRESEARFRRIFESNLDIVMVSNLASGKLVEVNQQFVRRTGISREQAIGREDVELGLWADARQRRRFLREIRSHGSVEGIEASIALGGKRNVAVLASAVTIQLEGQDCCMVVFRDISELKENEQRLKESEEKFRQIFEKSADVVVVSNLSDNCIVEVNDQFVQRTGLAREQVIGRSDLDFGLWNDPELRERLRRELAAHGYAQNLEVSFRFSEQEPAVAALISAVIVPLNGKQCAITVIRDISDLKEAERKLRDSEATLRKIFDSNLDSMTITDVDSGAYLDVNHEFVRSTGYDRQEALGKTMWELGLWREQEAYDRFTRTLSANGEVRNMQANLRAKDGRIIPSLISGVLVDLGGRMCSLSITRDISDRVEQERRLRQSEEYFRSLVESSSDVILVLDEQSTIIFSGGAGRGDLGYEPQELVGHNAFEFVHPDNLVEQAQMTRRAFKQPGEVVRYEASIRHRDGSWIACEFMGRATTDPTGRRILLTTMRNITERKRAEAELAKARDEALAASKSKSEFLSSMSHEIRTPMNAILGMADLLWETDLNAEQRRYLDTVIGNGNALLELINGILDLAKVESGRLSLEKVEFDVGDLTEKVADTLAVRAHAKGIELATRLVPGIPATLLGDPLRLRQILTNLIGNAIKFTDRGEVVVTVQTDPASNAPGSLLFTVADTGIGIAADKLSTIFSVFTQADSSTTRKYGGSGLGLSIVERLVALMDGRVWAESEVGKGSTFYFTAQLGVPQASAQIIRPLRDPDLSGVRALVVDDNAASRAVVAEILASKGANVATADCAAAALDALEASHRNGTPVALMLIDSRMPVMNGFELAERVNRAGAPHPAIVMMVSSNGHATKLSQVREMGVKHYTIKPIKRRELFAAISDALADTAPANGRAEPPRLVPAPAPQLRVVDRPLRILLADDSPDNRLLVRAFLRKTPYVLEETEDGQEAVQHFIAGIYDVVLMDIQMPVLDGYAAVRMIRNWERDNQRASTPIIALTASALDDAVRRAIDAGCDLHVSKPVKKSTLLAAIANAVEHEDTAEIREGRNGTNHG